jgi:hypothetical protein
MIGTTENMLPAIRKVIVMATKIIETSVMRIIEIIVEITAIAMVTGTDVIANNRHFDKIFNTFQSGG